MIRCRAARLLLLSILTIAAGVAFGQTALAAPPALNGASLRGLQIGATTTVTFTGAELTPGTRVLMPVAIARQEVQPGAAANQATIAITLDSSTPAGIYPLWLATEQGVSAPLAMGVDRLPQVPFAEQVASLPTAMTGAISGSTVLRTSFAGQAGQRIVVDVEGERLGNDLNPVLTLHDERDTQIQYSPPIPSLDGDARLAVTLPKDGRYTVELHDFLYRGPGPGVFRLKIGELQFADLAFPLGVTRGVATTVEFASTNLPAGLSASAGPAPVVGDGAVLLPNTLGMTGRRPRLVYSDLPETFEGSASPLAAPVAINGRIAVRGETDRHVVGVVPGQTYRIDVLAARAGSPLDGVLTVLNAQGADITPANFRDDRPDTTDPGVELTVPADQNALTIVLKDLEGRGGPDYIYRLSVAPATQAGFSLLALVDAVQVPRGGARLVRVRAERQGYNGAIRLSLSSLPAGVSATGLEIPPGSTDALVSLSASETAQAAELTQLAGEAVDNPALRAIARVNESRLSKQQPWLRASAPLAITSGSPLSLAWDADPASMRLPLASSVPVNVRIGRLGGVPGSVRLSLVTSQIVPQKTVKENNVDKQVPDLDRALRLDGMPVIAGDQSAAVVNVFVPGDLPAMPFDIALRAELLAADNATVVATAETPARRFTPTQPFTIELAGAPAVDAKAGSGDTGKLMGKIVRLPGFAQSVTIALEGLPAELPAPMIDVPGDKSEFELPVSFPFGAAPGALASVKVVGVSRPNPAATIRSNELAVAVNVVPGGPPPALYRLFEDESYFVSLLTEGAGKVSLEAGEKYVGAASFKVTPDQIVREKLPGLGVKVAENPGEGEYRWLRFAWKKRGGANILLQLRANGQWGGTRGQGAPGYRYEAGPANNAFNAEAIKVSEQLPDDWVVVERDLFADFGAFSLDGLAFTPGDGEYGLFDHVYLARTQADLQGCPQPPAPEKPLALFEDEADFPGKLLEGAGSATLFADEKYTGASSVKVTPDQKFVANLPGVRVNIRQNPAPGEYRYVQFAWKKKGGERICLQIGHDGRFGPTPPNTASFRYDAGPAATPTFEAAVRVDANLPSDFVVVTRDLYADFGEFTFTGLSLAPADGEHALYDHIYLGKTRRDFELVKP